MPGEGQDRAEPPRWGERSLAPAARGPRPLAGRELAAYRRMARGLSFSALALGLLLSTGGLTAIGPARVVLVIVAGAFALAGLTGYVLVNTGRLPRRTSPGVPSRTRAVARSNAGRFAVGLAIVGLAFLGASTLVVPAVENTPAEPLGMNLVLVCLMSSLSCFVAAAIAVAIAVLSDGRDEEPDIGAGPGASPGPGRGRRPVDYHSDWIVRPRD